MPWSTSHWRCIAFIAMICLASQAIAADHVDGPRTTNAGAAGLAALDLNDLYVFVSPVNRNNTVIALTTGGRVGIVNPITFLPGAVFEIRVSNDGDSTTDEVIFQAIFSNADRFGRQNYTIRLIRQNRGGDPAIVARGLTGQTVAGSLGMKVQAGIFDDPFFFDSDAFARFRSAVQAGADLNGRVNAFNAQAHRNGFPANTLAIVIELPRTELQSKASDPNITVWLRTLRPGTGVQFDRTGLPAINTAVLFPFPLPNPTRPGLQDVFNDRTPAGDASLREEAAQRINLIYGLPLDSAPPGFLSARQLAAAVLPDVMPFNTTSTAGFLNGRRLTDDVIDAELGLLTGGALTTDGVSNDSTFLTKFPYLAAAKK
jgi:hypothetical protein